MLSNGVVDRRPQVYIRRLISRVSKKPQKMSKCLRHLSGFTLERRKPTSYSQRFQTSVFVLEAVPQYDRGLFDLRTMYDPGDCLCGLCLRPQASRVSSLVTLGTITHLFYVGALAESGSYPYEKRNLDGRSKLQRWHTSVSLEWLC